MESKSSWDYTTVQLAIDQKMKLLQQNSLIKIGANSDFVSK